MSVNPDILKQYATSQALTTRRNLYQCIVGPSLTELLLGHLDLQPTSSFLDVGCGYGADIQTLLTHFSRLSAVGIDNSSNQIEEAKLKSPQATFHVASILDFDLQQQFDRILVRHVLHLVNNPEQAIANVLKHLKPHGRAVFVVHSAESQPHYAEWLKWFEAKTGIAYVSPSDAFTVETHVDLFRTFSNNLTVEKSAQTLKLTDAGPYIAYFQSQKRWSRQPTDEEMALLFEHVRSEIETDLARKGYFEDLSVNGITTLKQ